MTHTISEKHKNIIRRSRPLAKIVKPLGSGDINEVVLVDDEVFRFPKNKEGRHTLHYEAIILEKLAGKVSVQIPEVRNLDPDGLYGIFSYVPGRILSSEEIISFANEQKQRLAQSVAVFMREVNNALNAREISKLSRQQYLPWRDDEANYYETILSWLPQTKHHNLYATYYDKYTHLRSQVGLPKKTVIYGDFHSGNMLFNKVNELTGIIDFGDLSVGTIIGDLRQLYRLGEDIVRMITEELHGDFGDINFELVRMRAIIHEISVLMRPESLPPQINPRAQLAETLLAKWLGKNWGEL